MSKPTQADRLLAYLRANPGASSLEITRALSLVNVTGRVSDLRARGITVECRKRRDSVDGYWIVEPARLPVTTGEQLGWTA